MSATKKVSVEFKSDSFPNIVWILEYKEKPELEIVRINGRETGKFDGVTISQAYEELDKAIA